MSPRLVEFLKQHEGCRLEAYQDSGGVWTIGYGSTGNVHPGQTITQAEADERLAEDIARTELAVNEMLRPTLTDGQHDALVSFAFNVGASNLATSTLLKRVNEGDLDAVPAELMRWTHAGGREVAGLRHRREDEVALWKET